MKLLTGKAEIIYLLTKVIEKYEAATGTSIIKNSNRKNYEPIARQLSEISNRLPYTAEELGHDPYLIDANPQGLEYPLRKYDITGNQIKDAYYNQIVANPRSFLVDACYIYLYGQGRKGFERDPHDPQLLAAPLEYLASRPAEQSSRAESHRSWWLILGIGLGIALAFTSYMWRQSALNLATLRNDLKILPYRPTDQEIAQLEGIWLSYIGSPQARISDPHRYHLVVANLIDLRYKNGYFVMTRYGASFDHEGYAQFEAPGIVSLHTYVKNRRGGIQSPRHSLLRLDQPKGLVPVISASWNFDVGEKNEIIGIREVYLKQGQGGRIEEVMNTVENAACKCKIIHWRQENGQLKTYQLKNQLLDELPDSRLRQLINEESILLRQPSDSILLKAKLPR